jgi:hypothetical protein
MPACEVFKYYTSFFNFSGTRLEIEELENVCGRRPRKEKQKGFEMIRNQGI